MEKSVAESVPVDDDRKSKRARQSHLFDVMVAVTTSKAKTNEKSSARIMAAAKWILEPHFKFQSFVLWKNGAKNIQSKSRKTHTKRLYGIITLTVRVPIKFEKLMKWLILPLCFLTHFVQRRRMNLQIKISLCPLAPFPPFFHPFWVSHFFTHEMSVSVGKKLDFKSFKCQWRVRNVIVCEIQISGVVCI